ncbi:MAG: YggT family protein [Chloroflexi bacterium]|nr:YggT family protein [Chloroflexota bacterium]
MSDYQTTHDASIDRRQETVVTQQPGYVASEQVTYDVASERRQGVLLFNQILWTLLGGLEVLLVLRLMLKLFAANPNSGFAVFIYGITGAFTAPFSGLFAIPAAGGSVFETTTIVAMLVYALIFWGIMRIIPIFTNRPSARTFTRTSREQTPGGQGNERSTSTITKD